MQKFSEIILHIGLHKTGTTTIQTQLAHHAEGLEAQGVAVYAPRELDGNGSWLFHALLDRLRMNSERVDPRVIEEFEAFARRTSAVRPRRVLQKMVEARGTGANLDGGAAAGGLAGDWDLGGFRGGAGRFAGPVSRAGAWACESVDVAGGALDAG